MPSPYTTESTNSAIDRMHPNMLTRFTVCSYGTTTRSSQRTLVVDLSDPKASHLERLHLETAKKLELVQLCASSNAIIPATLQ
jgi:hypothetical protein